MRRIAVLIGTRPGIIKMAPIIHQLQGQGEAPVVIHTGQHYSLSMDLNVMTDVGLDAPTHQITRPADCVSHAQQTAYMLTAIETILERDAVDTLLVCGDANTNLAGALAARKIHVTVGHVEAGLRSYDWRMPEEHNRVIIDHISEYLFAPTHLARRHLEDDGVRGAVFVVGNTIVDATLRNVERAVARGRMAWVKDDDYVVLTLHREENVDNKEVLQGILAALRDIGRQGRVNLVFPVHPRTSKRIEEFGLGDLLEEIRGLRLVEPLGYLDFLALLRDARLVMTDSGGVQEESCILHVPCITLRESTERQETVDVGINHVAGTSRETIVALYERITAGDLAPGDYRNPYGDGETARRIVETCLNGAPADEFDG